MSFLHTTIYRDQLPSSSDFFNRPFSSLVQFVEVYKLHVAHESEKVAEKRRKKQEDAQKRKEFLREHGVEPGFLTGTWMDKFGTVEGDQAKAIREGKEQEADADVQSPLAMQAAAAGVGATPVVNAQDQDELAGGETPAREKKKPKMWLGIW